MRIIVLLFILIPAIEVTILAGIVGWIGGLNTLLSIVVTGIVGAIVARRAGVGVLHRIRSEMAQGRLPAGTLVDGAIILVAGALLVTPGVLTDACGFLMLIPRVRSAMKSLLARRFENAIRIEGAQVIEHGPVIDVGDPNGSLTRARAETKAPHATSGGNGTNR